jgi:hypothetical protein
MKKWLFEFLWGKFKIGIFKNSEVAPKGILGLGEGAQRRKRSG